MMMDSFFKALVVLALVCGCFGASLGSNDVHNDTCPKSSHVDCKCGVTTVKVPVEICHNQETDQCGPCKESLASALKKCDRYKYCYSCFKDDGTCDSCLLHRTGPYCETEVNKTVMYENDGRRSKRGTVGKCDFPKVYAGNMLCSLKKDTMECDVECLWGHKFSNGNDVQHFRCDGKTGEWSPKQQDCDARVTCHLELVNTDLAAKKVCYTGIRWEPPKCDVTCGGKTDTHYCSRTGRWYPSLPKCAKAKTEKITDLIELPNGHFQETIEDLDQDGKIVHVAVYD